MAGVAVRSRGVTADRGAEVVAGQLPSSVIINTLAAGGQGGGGPDNLLVGSGALSTPIASSQATFSASQSLANPNKTFTGALSGYAFYSGVPGAGQGTLQGGACQAVMYMNGGAGQSISPALLGWESIGTVDGATSAGTMGTAIGGQSTAFVQNSVTLTNLIAHNIRAPFSNGGSPTVTNAYSLKIANPAIGTNQWSIFSQGRNAFVTDGSRNIIEIVGSGGLLQWSVPANAGKIIGYASDGSSQRVVLDTTDGATSRLNVSFFNGTMAGVVVNDFGGSGTGNLIDLQKSGASKFAVTGTGSLVVSGTAGTVSPAAGGAGALPATPAGYLTLSINGVSRQVAYY